jgi:hypothetical protein
VIDEVQEIEAARPLAILEADDAGHGSRPGQDEDDEERDAGDQTSDDEGRVINIGRRRHCNLSVVGRREGA